VWAMAATSGTISARSAARTSGVSGGKSTEQAAADFGTNEKYVRQAEKLLNEEPETFAAIEAGEKTLQNVKTEKNREKLAVAKAAPIDS
jgi:hypothetical protein